MRKLINTNNGTPTPGYGAALCLVVSTSVLELRNGHDQVDWPHSTFRLSQTTFRLSQMACAGPRQWDSYPHIPTRCQTRLALNSTLHPALKCPTDYTHKGHCITQKHRSLDSEYLRSLGPDATWIYSQVLLLAQFPLGSGPHWWLSFWPKKLSFGQRSDRKARYHGSEQRTLLNILPGVCSQKCCLRSD